MKFRKVISYILTAAMTLSASSLCLTGCMQAAAADIITNGELLRLINTKFGFSGYEKTEPYYPGVPTTDEYFAAVQTAHEYEVLDELVKDFKTSDAVTREFFAMAASGAIYDDNTKEITISDISDITYKDDVLTVLNYGIMELDNGKFDPKKTMSASECELMLDAAHFVWAHCTVKEPEYNVSFKEGAVDLSGIDCYYYDEASGTMKTDENKKAANNRKLEENHFSYDQSSGNISVDSAAGLGLAEGVTVAVPTGDFVHPYEVRKVTSIETAPDGTSIVHTQEGDPADLIETYKVEQHLTPDFSKIEYILDANGNKVYPTAANYDSATGDMMLTGASVSKLSNRSAVAKTGFDPNASFKIDVDGYSLELSVDDSSISVTAEVALENDPKELSAAEEAKWHGSKKYGAKASATFKASNMAVDCKYDFWDGYAKAVLTNDLSDKISIGGGYSNEGSASKDMSKKKQEIENQPRISKSIPVGLIPFPTGIGDLTFYLEPKLNFSISGELSITVSRVGLAVGVEYRRWHGISRVWDEGRKTVNAHAEVKIEATFSLDIRAEICFGALKIGVEPEIGVGGQAAVDLTGIDYGEADQTYLLCIDLRIYPIVRGKAYVKIKIPIVGEQGGEIGLDILGEDTTWGHWHFENYNGEGMGLVPECTKDKRMNQKKDNETAAAGVTVGDGLKLTADTLEVNIGDKVSVGITEVPSGYNYEDILVKNSDNEIIKLESKAVQATYNADPFRHFVGSLHGAAGRAADLLMGTRAGYCLDSFFCKADALKKGESRLTFTTKDGKYSAECLVRVFDPNEPLDYAVKLESYSVVLGTGERLQMKIQSLPWYLTEDDIVWKSADESLCSVTPDGLLSVYEKGNVQISASTPDGRSTAMVTVMISDIAAV